MITIRIVAREAAYITGMGGANKYCDGDNDRVYALRLRRNK